MKYTFPLFIALVLLACNNNTTAYDASGTFESDEVIVSAEQNGQLLVFNVLEGDSLSAGQVVGYIDSTNLVLQKKQVQSMIRSLPEKTADAGPQVKLLRNQLAVQQAQLDQLLSERDRYERALKADVATQKQLDDLDAQIVQQQKLLQVTEQQINVQLNVTGTQNRAILSETDPLQQQVALINQQISKTVIVNPINGTVLAKYAQQGEVTGAGKALYKIADLSYLNLRAYITGAQLPAVQLNQQLTVLVDSGSKGYRSYTGNITWIADKAEFTPKTIQTKEERANLVYAIKIRVKNDGLLKIGMYGEVVLQPGIVKAAQ